MSGARSPGRLRHDVGEAIAAKGLWRPGERVAVAVSGGRDSVCLLDLLLATARWHGGVLAVVTVDHGTRPGSADDAAFVEDLAARHGLPCARFDLGLGEGASEDACRQARHAVFDALDTDVVALAHHADDQAETVLVNLLRGTGPVGLEGMAWRRGRTVRPLLGTSRDEVAAWAAWRGLSWREDPTNATDRFLRNRVRNEVLPLLESLREGAGEALARSATLAAEQGELLDRLAADLLEGPSADRLAAAHPALARRALHRAFAPLTTAQADLVLGAVARGGGRIDLGGGRIVVVAGGRVSLDRR